MRVFLTGATGALGRHLVPQLIAAGHDVTTTTRTPQKLTKLRETGAKAMLVDGLDRDAVIAAVRAAEPEVIVHQMTALTEMRSLRKMDTVFAATNELRTRGTDNLLAAAGDVGVRRVVAQGHSLVYEHSGDRIKAEDARQTTNPPRSAAKTVAALQYLDRTVTQAVPEGIVLRYGTFYGPGASEPIVEAVRKRQLPVIGDGAGIWSFIETTDAASATLAAIERGAPGAYNVVDDEPAPAAEWLPYLAEIVGAKPPLSVPVWLGRLLAGDFVVGLMTTARGSSNAKARQELGWQPQDPSWREGFRAWVDGSRTGAAHHGSARRP